MNTTSASDCAPQGKPTFVKTPFRPIKDASEMVAQCEIQIDFSQIKPEGVRRLLEGGWTFHIDTGGGR